MAPYIWSSTVLHDIEQQGQSLVSQRRIAAWPLQRSKGGGVQTNQCLLPRHTHDIPGLNFPLRISMAARLCLRDLGMGLMYVIFNLAHAGTRLQYSLCVCVCVCYRSSGHIACSTTPSEVPTESARCKEQNEWGNFAKHS